ncbi:hypothetical protein Pla111_11380 [Botrimarina hoheduenensis]|uniref:PEP-CTERM protein-sorting domain-containing protein n=2 Tax=Botrimarina hoheduenensis TaxID=2528000 RepID=A0A5C5WBA5_9BACT|nr:hypothetical protein Pla111_11380 [Botrimarina hoheduenensis]
MRLLLAMGCALVLPCGVLSAAVFDLASATDLFVPTFRGNAHTTWVGWDTFDDGGTLSEVINDTTPDLGTDPGSFVTTSGEDHLSGSGNYYSGGTPVAETVTFATHAGVDGFTTVIVQAMTLFGGWGDVVQFGTIDGVAPILVLQSDNQRTSFGTTGGSLFVKYEIAGPITTPEFAITTSGFGSPTSFDQLVIDTLWSPTGYATDTAVATPEPASTIAALIAIVGFAVRPRRWSSPSLRR